MSEQEVPASPHDPVTGELYLSDQEYEFVISRTNHQCALLKQCRDSGRLGQTEFCSHKLDFDHIQPRSLGGDNSFTNLRLLCDTKNRSRAIEPATIWSEENFWDAQIRPAALREIQRIAGYDALLDNSEIWPAVIAHRNSLRRMTTLLPGATGIGKAIAAMATLFAINEVVNKAGKGRPRIKHVLWLAVDRTLRNLTAGELRDDAYNHGIISRPPHVRTLKGFNDFSAGPQGADICVACPQSIFRADDNDSSKELRRSAHEIRKAVEKFDTIIFDEGDWAGEQVRWICAAATHALKFALTASPPVIEGIDPEVAARFLKHFALISPEAIADYTRAVEMDGCLKLIDEDKLLVTTSGHSGFNFLDSGLRGSDPGRAGPDHPVFLPAILHAVMDADRLETRMQELRPDDWFSPHIIVRLSRIEDIKALYFALPQALSRLPLRNPGWEPTAIFQGHTAWKDRGRVVLSLEEADLSGRDRRTGQWTHPFMRAAREQSGRADQRSRRILLMSNIGVRGINNWTIQSAVDCMTRIGTTEIIQFDFGRPIRLPPHLSSWLNDTALRSFLTLKIYVPEMAGNEHKPSAVSDAARFILNMKEIIGGRGFLTWRDLIDGRGPDDLGDLENGHNTQSFTATDRFHVMNRLGRAIQEEGGVTSERIAEIAGSLIPEPTPRRREQAAFYASKLLQEPEFRQNEVLAASIEREARIAPVRPIINLKPQQHYEIEQLKEYVRDDPEYAELRDSYLLALDKNEILTVHSVSKSLREQQVRFYREPSRIWKLNRPDGVLVTVTNELIGQLMNGIDEGTRQAVRNNAHRAMNIAAQTLFNIDSAANDSPMDQHAYHIAILGRCRRRLQEMARAQLVKWRVLGHMAVLAELEQ